MAGGGRRVLLGVLGLANLALFALGWKLLTNPPEAEAGRAVEPAAIGVEIPGDEELPRASLAALPETLERPLFWKGRRPYVPPAPAAPKRPKPVAKAEPPKGVTLVGIVRTGPHALAMVTRKEGGVVRLRSGDSLEGWKVSEIRERSLVLVRGGRSHELGMPSPGDPGSVSDWEPVQRPPAASGSEPAAPNGDGAGEGARERPERTGDADGEKSRAEIMAEINRERLRRGREAYMKQHGEAGAD